MQAAIHVLRILKEKLKKCKKRVEKRMQGHITFDEGYELASEMQGIQRAIRHINCQIRLLKY